MPLVNKPSSSQIQVKTQETGQSSETRWEIQTPNNGAKMDNGSTMTNNTPNPRHASDEYFNFPDMDTLIHDFSGGRQQEPEIDNPSPAREGYQVDPSYNNDKVFLKFFVKFDYEIYVFSWFNTNMLLVYAELRRSKSMKKSRAIDYRMMSFEYIFVDEISKLMFACV